MVEIKDPTPYESWIEAQEIPVHKGYAAEDIPNLPMEQWVDSRLGRGQSGANQVIFIWTARSRPVVASGSGSIASNQPLTDCIAFQSF